MNDKILIDRELLRVIESYMPYGSTLQLELSATLAAAPDDEIKHIAELEGTIGRERIRHGNMMAEQILRVAELERDKADLLENGDRLMRAADGWKEQCKELQTAPGLYPAAGAQEKTK